MATIHDTAAAVLQHFPNGLSTSAFQRLVYLTQGWSLALRNELMFQGEFEAWDSGPVSRTLYEKHSDMFSVHVWPYGDPTLLNDAENIIVDTVAKKYGQLSGMMMSELPIVKGTPWIRAFHNPKNKKGSRVTLAQDEMQRHFTALLLPRGYKRRQPAGRR